MKWSAAAALCAAPLALASVMDAPLVARGYSESSGSSSGSSYGSSSSGSKSSVSVGSTIVIEDVLVLWVNLGGDSTTTTMNSYSSMTGSSGSTSTHTVTVGGAAGLVYTPDTIEAVVGDVVIFEFGEQNHTATQSNFATPCEKLDGGFDSGFMSNPNGTVNPPPKMAFQVMVATPLWFYCRQKVPKSHCGAGMTFSINPTANKTQADFEQMAIAQNGTGTTAAIVGGSATAAVAASTMIMAASTTAAVSESSSTGSSSSSSGSSGSTYMSSGSGSSGSSGECECACLCGLASFPSSVQGLDMYGGMPGSMPLSAMMT